MGDYNLKDKGRQKPEVGENSDMGIFQNEELLAVENGKSHGDNDRGSIVESMEEGSGEKNFFSHFFEKRFIPQATGLVNLPPLSLFLGDLL